MSDELCYCIYKYKGDVTLSILNVHTPTTEKLEEKKEEFSE